MSGAKSSHRQKREDAALAAAAVRKRAVVFGVFIVSASVVALFCCSRNDRPARSAASLSSATAPPSLGAPDPLTTSPLGNPAASASAGAPQPASAATSSAGSGGQPGPSSTAPRALGHAPPGGSPGAGQSIANAVAATDPRDLALLSRIERELGQNPPPAVHAILRRHREGAPRSELLALARALPELPLRVHVIRWIDEVSPAP